MNNQLQTLLQETLTSTGHVENCAIFRRKDVLLRGNSNGYTVCKLNMVYTTKAHLKLILFFSIIIKGFNFTLHQNNVQ